MSHLYEARELKEKYLEETKGYNTYEIMKIWEAHSETLAAGWITPDRETVAYVFS